MTATPYKRVIRALRKAGGRMLMENSHGTFWVLPNGWRFSVNYGTRGQVAKGMIEKIAAVTPEPIAIDLSKIGLTEHAKERIRLMSHQGTSPGVIGQTLREPQETYRSHGCVVFVGRDVTVVVGEESNAIVTVLWSREELWEKYPRPEKVAV